MSLTRVSLKDPGFYSYLIITPSSYMEAAESLKVYREKEGYITKILTIGEIQEGFSGQDLQEKIRNAIKFWHIKGGIRYVFLAGDNDSIPARIVLVRLGYGDDDYIPSDYYYMCIDGTWNADGDNTFGEIEDSVDLYPEVAVTRGTFHSKSEFMNYVNRVKYFEKTVGAYVKEALFHSSIIYAGADGSDYVNQIADVFPNSVEKHFLYQNQQDITIEDINSYLRGGIGYFLTMAHGDVNGFYANYGDVYYSISDIPNNVTSSTLVDIFSCHSGAIDRSCLLEGFLLREITIAARASSRNDFSFVTPMRASFYEEIASGKNLGDATMLHRLPYLSYGYDGYNGYRYLIMAMITLGDPLLRFYSEKPEKLFILSHEDDSDLHITVYSQDTIPIGGIKVVLYKEGEYLIIDTTNANGMVTIPLTMLIKGTHFVSLSGHNFLRTDTILDVLGTNRPIIKSLTIKGYAGNELLSGDSALVMVTGEVPFQLPLMMRLNCYVNVSNFYTDSLLVWGSFSVSKPIMIPWFSGNSLVYCKASLSNEVFFKDTTLLAFGPVVGVSRIKIGNDSLTLFLANEGMADSDALDVKVNTQSATYRFNLVLHSGEEHGIEFKTTERDYPVKIHIFSNIIDTQIIIKERSCNAPPETVYTISIPLGIKLFWEQKSGYYNLYRGTDSFNLSKVNVLPLKYPYYVDDHLSPDSIYYYAVTFLDSLGIESDFSQIVKGIPNPRLVSGWPVSASGLGYSSLLVADITPLYDGKEVIIGSFEDSLVYAFSKDGILLPGWPFNIGDIVYSAPAAKDFDNDGYDEVIVAGGGSYTHIWVLKGDGSVLDGWPVYIRKGNFTGPAIADLNGDSIPEIVFVSRSGGVYVYDVHGAMLDSIHLYAGGFSPASLGDINYDDTMDIVIGCKAPVEDSAGLWVLHMVNDTELVVNSGFPKGSFSFNSPLVIGDVRPDIPGMEIFGCSTRGEAVLFNCDGDTIWTRPVNNLDYFYNPSISDINGDGIPELLVNQGTGIAVFTSNGDYYPGYPITKAAGGPHQCITVDLNGDGYNEIIKGSVDGNLYALTENVEIYPGFPIDLNGYVYPTSTVADIDDDGMLELVSSSFASMIFAYELGIPDSFIGDWPTYQHDNQRTGNYNYINYVSSYKEDLYKVDKELKKDQIVHSILYFGEDWSRVREVSFYDVTGRKILCVHKPLGKFIKLNNGIFFGVLRMKNGKILVKRILSMP